MKTILVPTDFSPISHNACKYAAALAKALGASVQLLHVYQEYPGTAMAPETWVVTVSELSVQLQKQMNKLVDELSTETGVQVNGEVRDGFRVETIAEKAVEIGADLIIMGVYSGHRSMLWGSTVYKTVRSTQMPLLVVPENAGYQPLKNMLLAADYKEALSHRLFEPLYFLYTKFDAALRVLHVEQSGVAPNADQVPQQLALTLALSKFSFLSDVVEAESVEQGIKIFIERHPTDLLVMVAHHHNIFDRMFGQIHTRNISFELAQPLLVLKTT